MQPDLSARRKLPARAQRINGPELKSFLMRTSWLNGNEYLETVVENSVSAMEERKN